MADRISEFLYGTEHVRDQPKETQGRIEEFLSKEGQPAEPPKDRIAEMLNEVSNVPETNTVDIGTSPSRVGFKHQTGISGRDAGPAQNAIPNTGVYFGARAVAGLTNKAVESLANPFSGPISRDEGTTPLDKLTRSKYLAGLFPLQAVPTAIEGILGEEKTRAAYDYVKAGEYGLNPSIDLLRIGKLLGNEKVNRFVDKIAGDVPEVGAFLDSVDATRRYRSDRAAQRGPVSLVWNESIETVVDIATFLAEMRMTGKILPAGPSVRSNKLAKAITTGMQQAKYKGMTPRMQKLFNASNKARMADILRGAARLGTYRYMTAEGTEQDRIKQGLWSLLYASTPAITGAALGKMGQAAASKVAPKAIDFLFNSILSSSQYVDIAKQSGGLNRHFFAAAVPLALSDAFFSVSTMGLPGQRQRHFIDKYHGFLTKKYKNFNTKRGIKKMPFKEFVKQEELSYKRRGEVFKILTRNPTINVPTALGIVDSKINEDGTINFIKQSLSEDGAKLTYSEYVKDRETVRKVDDGGFELSRKDFIERYQVSPDKLLYGTDGNKVQNVLIMEEFRSDNNTAVTLRPMIERDTFGEAKTGNTNLAPRITPEEIAVIDRYAKEETFAPDAVKEISKVDYRLDTSGDEPGLKKVLVTEHERLPPSKMKGTARRRLVGKVEKAVEEKLTKTNWDRVPQLVQDIVLERLYDVRKGDAKAIGEELDKIIDSMKNEMILIEGEPNDRESKYFLDGNIVSRSQVPFALLAMRLHPDQLHFSSYRLSRDSLKFSDEMRHFITKDVEYNLTKEQLETLEQAREEQRETMLKDIVKVREKLMDEYVDFDGKGLMVEDMLDSQRMWPEYQIGFYGGASTTYDGVGPAGYDYRITVFRDREGVNPEIIASFGHYDGAIGHLRTNVRTDAEGKRVFFIEEIQSDVGNALRAYDHDKKIYEEVRAAGQSVMDEVDRLRRETEVLRARWIDLKKRTPRELRSSSKELEKAGDAFLASSVKRAKLQEKIDIYRNFRPWSEEKYNYNKDITNKWVERASRQAIRMAMDAGADRIAWIKGEQNAKRWERDPEKWELQLYDKMIPNVLKKLLGNKNIEQVEMGDMDVADDLRRLQNTLPITDENRKEVTGSPYKSTLSSRYAAAKNAFMERYKIDSEELDMIFKDDPKNLDLNVMLLATQGSSALKVVMDEGGKPVAVPVVDPSHDDISRRIRENLAKTELIMLDDKVKAIRRRLDRLLAYKEREAPYPSGEGNQYHVFKNIIEAKEDLEKADVLGAKKEADQLAPDGVGRTVDELDMFGKDLTVITENAMLQYIYDKVPNEGRVAQYFKRLLESALTSPFSKPQIKRGDAPANWRELVVTEGMQSKNLDQFADMVGLRHTGALVKYAWDAVSLIYAEDVSMISKKSARRKFKQQKTKDLLDLMSFAAAEVGVNLNSTAKRYYKTLEGIGGSFKTPEEADAYVQSMTDFYQRLGKTYTAADLNDWKTKRSPMSFWKMLGDVSPGLQAYILWNKANVENKLLSEGISSGVFDQSNLLRTMREGYTRRVFDMKDQEKKGNKYMTAIANARVISRQFRTYPEFVHGMTKSIHPVTDYSVAAGAYARDMLQRLERQRYIDLLKQVSASDGTRMVMYEYMVPDKVIDKKKWLTDRGYKNIKDAPGLAEWHRGNFRIPWVHDSVFNTINRIFLDDGKERIKALRKMNSTIKRIVMWSPYQYQIQIASSAAVWLPGGPLGSKALQYVWKPLLTLSPFRKAWFGKESTRQKLWDRTYQPGDHLKEYDADNDRLVTFASLGMSGLDYRQIKRNLYDYATTADSPYKKADVDMLWDSLNMKYGLDIQVFNNYLGRIMFEVTNSLYDKMAREAGYDPTSKDMHRDSARRAVMVANDITGMMNKAIYGNEGPYMQALFFARDFTYSYLRQVTGAAYWAGTAVGLDPAAHHKFRTGDASSLFNSLLHGEKSRADMNAVSKYYGQNLMKVYLWHFVASNAIQLAINQLFGSEEDKGKMTIDNEKGKRMKIKLPWKNEDGANVYIDFMAFREFPQTVGYLTNPGGLMVNKMNAGLKLFLELALNVDYRRDGVWDFEGGGAKTWGDIAIHALGAATPTPLKPGFNTKGVNRAIYMAFQGLGIPISVGNPTQGFPTWYIDRLRKVAAEERYADKELRDQLYLADEEKLVEMYTEGKMSASRLKRILRARRRPVYKLIKANRKSLAERGLY